MARRRQRHRPGAGRIARQLGADRFAPHLAHVEADIIAPALTKGCDLVVVLLGQQRAGDIDKPAARFHEVGCLVEERCLFGASAVPAAGR